MHLTRPPRMEGKVKNAKMNPVRKPKRVHLKKPVFEKTSEYTEKQLRDYQLKSKYH